MSALLKFFGDRNKSKQGAGLAATASSQESDLPAPHLDETINLLEDFSEDVPGQELRRLWGECQANAHSDGDAGGKSLHSIASAVIEFYEGKIVKLGGGHAASMVCALARQLFRSLASVEDKQTNPVSSSSSKDSNNNHENNADLPKLISVTSLFSPLPDSRGWDDFLDLLHALSILMRWPRNCLAVKQTMDTQFSYLILEMGRQLQTQFGSCHMVLEEEVLCKLFRALLLVIQLIGQGFDLEPLEFSDFLLPQPWSQAVVNQLLEETSRDWQTVISRESLLNEEHSSLTSEGRKMKTDYLQNLVSAGSLKWLLDLLMAIVGWQQLSHVSEKVKVWMMIVEVEALHGVIGLTSTCPNVILSEVSVFQAVERSFDMKLRVDILHKPIFVRRQLLCLRFNFSLLKHLQKAKPEASHYSLRLLSSAAVADLFAWLSREFDQLRSPGDWVQQMAESRDHFVLIEQELRIGRVATSHDLWPWREEESRISSKREKVRGTELANYRILTKSTRSSVLNALKTYAGSLIWDSVISELLGYYLLSRESESTASAPSKIPKEDLHYVYEAFDCFFRNFSVPLVSLEAINEEGPGLSIPLTQLKFVEFISQMFTAADASSIFSLISEFETFNFILGDQFLLAYSNFPTYVSEIFEDAQFDWGAQNSLYIRLSCVKKRQYHPIYLWLYLQKNIMDFFHGLVVFSIHFHLEQLSVQSYLSPEDIILKVMTRYTLSLCKHSHSPGHVVYQMVSLVLNLNDIVRSMAFETSLNFKQRMVRCLLDIIDYQLRGKVPGTADKSFMEMAGCFGVVQALLHFLLPWSDAQLTCKDFFMSPDGNVTLDLSHEIGLLTRGRSGSNPSIVSNSSVSITGVSLRKERRLSDPLVRGIDNADKSIKIRQYLFTITALLLNEHFQMAGLEIMEAIITSCASSMISMEKSGTEYSERQKNKLALRSLVAEVLAILFQLVSVSGRLPNRKFGVVTACRCLDSISNILRDESLVTSRIYIQEFIRRENMICELLRSLARRFGDQDLPSPTSQSNEVFDFALSHRTILGAGLAALTAIVSGNEACKNALRVLLSTSREKFGSSRVRFGSSFSFSSLDSKEKPFAPSWSKSASGLVGLILTADRSPSEETIVILLDVMLDGPHAGKEYRSLFGKVSSSSALPGLFARHEDDKPTIRNTAILPDFFQLIPHCSLPIQRFALESFRNLVSGRGSLVNLAVCSSARPKVFDVVLDLFPYIPDSIQTCNAELLDFLGRYMVSVSSLKHLFRILQRNDGSSPAYAWKVIQALQGMFREEFGPKHTFVFDGNQSGLLLPAIYRWPKTKGFSFSCWLRVESPKIDYNSISYVPRVFSLRDQNGCGFQLLLKQPKPGGAITLCFQYINDQGATLSASPEPHYGMELMEDKWYFLALSLTSPHFYARSELKLYLDHLLYKEEISLWKMPETVPEPLIGDGARRYRNKKEHQTLRGQLGAIYFFGEALTDQQVQGIYALGPDYIYNFKSHIVGSRDFSASAVKRRGDKKSAIDDGSVTAKILLAYNPVVLRGKYFVDNTPEKNEVLWRLPNGVEVNDDLRADLPKHCRMHAMRLPGTYRSTLQDVRLALNSLGGIKVVIPLFAQLISHDRFRMLRSDSSESFDDGDGLSNQALDGNFFPAVLGLFTTLLEDNDENKRIFLRCGGFAVIRDFLERAPADCFNLITLNQFIAILENLKDDSGAKESCFDAILCNFKLWSRSSALVQICWLDWLTNAMRDWALSHFPSASSPQRFIDTFYAHYDYIGPLQSPSSPLSSSAHNGSNVGEMDFIGRSLDYVEGDKDEYPSARLSLSPPPIVSRTEHWDIIRSALSDEQLQQIRSKIYRLIKLCIDQDMYTFEAIVGLIKYLVKTKDIRNKVETLQFLNDLLVLTAGPEKRRTILLPFTLRDSLSSFQSLLEINNLQVLRSVMYLTSTIAHFASNLGSSYYSLISPSQRLAPITTQHDREIGRMHVGIESPTSPYHQSPLGSPAGALLEASSRADRAFVEFSDLQKNIPLICEAMLLRIPPEHEEELAPWILSILFNILHGTLAVPSEMETPILKSHFSIECDTVYYPAIYCTIIRLLSSHAMLMKNFGDVVLERMSKILSNRDTALQIAAISGWAVDLASLLRLQSTTYLADTSNSWCTVGGIMHTVEILTSLIHYASLLKQSDRSAIYGSSQPPLTAVDNSGAARETLIILHDIFADYQKSALFLVFRVVILSFSVWDLSNLSISKSGLLVVSKFGLSLLDHLVWFNDSDNWKKENGLSQIWIDGLLPLVKSKLKDDFLEVDFIYENLYRDDSSSKDHHIVFNWTLIKAFLSVAGLFVDCQNIFVGIENELRAVVEDGKKMPNALKPCCRTREDETELRGLLFLLALHILMQFHRSLVTFHPQGNWSACFAPAYEHILNSLQSSNKGIFLCERLHLVGMSSSLRLLDRENSFVGHLFTQSLQELQDLINAISSHTSFDSDGDANCSQVKLDSALNVMVNLRGQNVPPFRFKDACKQMDEAPRKEVFFCADQEFVDVLFTHGVRFGEESSQANKCFVWQAAAKFLDCFCLIMVDEMSRLLVDGIRTDAPSSILSSEILSTKLPSPLRQEVNAGQPNDVVELVNQLEWNRLTALLRIEEINNRRAEMKRSRLFAQLANERGPWGYSVDHKKEIYWTLDDNELNTHLKLRLKRNIFGTRHTIASFKASGKFESLSDDNTELVDASPRGWVEIDLKKFKPITPGGSKKRHLANEDENEKDDEDFSDGEEDAQGEDAHAMDSILPGDSDVLSIDAEIISPATNSSGGKTSGKLEVSRLKMSFQRHSELADYDFENKTGNNEFLWACQCFPSMSWSGSDITGVYRRHYQLRNVALEVFFTNRTSLFFNLFEGNAAKRVYSFLVRRMKTPNLNMIFTGRPQNAISRVFTASGLTLTQAWVARKISNFDYLMFLNFIAGRSYNDLAQYPVFPWVLSNYTSSKIDLRDPKNYRLFDRPMGAQLDSQRDLLMEKYQSSLQLQDEGIYPYNCGSHYSTSAMVLWYLIRMEPFTSYHVWLQDGKFDRPDRLFHNIGSTFHGCTTNTQDVKELIPEFFCNPEFLSNINHICLGTRQDGDTIDDVLLPRWCKNPVDFVRIHRDALESEYVSSQLHNWIDLIFGCKQRPPYLNGGSEKAVQACNVFFHLSYADAVDLDAMKASDSDLYDRTIQQIDNYGQTPLQLFKKEHPRRKSLLEVEDILWPIASIVVGADTITNSQDAALEKPKRVLCYGEYKISKVPVIFLASCSETERLITVDTNRVLGYHLFQMRNPSHIPPFNIKLDKTAVTQTGGQGGQRSSTSLISYLPYTSASREKVVGVPFASAVVLNASLLDNLSSHFSYASLDIGGRQNKSKYLDEETKLRGRLPEEKRPSRAMSLKPSMKLLVPSVASTSWPDIDKATPTPSNELLFSPLSRNEGKEELDFQPTPQFSVDQSGSESGGNFKESPATVIRKVNHRKADRVDYHLSSHLFYCMGPLKLIFSCGHWDNTFKVTFAETGRLIQSISHHREVVTCIAGASDFGRHWIVVGSKDCTVTVWEIFPERETEPVHATPAHTLYGHDDTVNCLVVNAELDLIVSGSDDGTIMIHSLREGSYIRSIIVGAITDTASVQASPSQGSHKSIAGMSMDGMVSPMTPRHAVQANTQSQQFTAQQLEKALCRVHLLGLSKDGHIVAFSNDGHILASYTQNGRYLKLIQVRERIHAMCLSEDGRTVLTGGERGLVVIRWVHNLAIASTGARRGLESVIDGSNEPDFEPFSAPIRSLAFTANERHLLVGLDNGEVRILAQDSEYLRRKLHRQLIEIGMLSI